MLVHARDPDDPAAAARCHHPSGHTLHHDERAVEVGGHDASPRFELDLEEQRALAGSGIVHEDVDAAELVGERIDHIAASRDVRDIKVGDHGAPSLGFDQTRGLLRARKAQHAGPTLVARESSLRRGSPGRGESQACDSRDRRR